MEEGRRAAESQLGPQSRAQRTAKASRAPGRPQGPSWANRTSALAFRQMNRHVEAAESGSGGRVPVLASPHPPAPPVPGCRSKDDICIVSVVSNWAACGSPAPGPESRPSGLQNGHPKPYLSAPRCSRSDCGPRAHPWRRRAAGCRPPWSARAGARAAGFGGAAAAAPGPRSRRCGPGVGCSARSAHTPRNRSTALPPAMALIMCPSLQVFCFCLLL